MTNEQAIVEKNLKRFDELDFEAWNKKNWKLFDEIHAPDVLVVMADGTRTKGIEAHNNAMKGFLKMMDGQITAHPIKIGQGEWTAVTGETSITLPNGKTLKSLMCTVARWKDGRIIEEYLFQDTGPMMKMLSNTQPETH
jgi:hypothetical protein